MRRLGIDPFLLNFITLGVIMTLMILSIISIYQHGESEKPQSNFTAQREAVKNIEDIRDDINRIQGSVLSLDNKVNELFFLENKNTTPTR